VQELIAYLFAPVARITTKKSPVLVG